MGVGGSISTPDGVKKLGGGRVSGELDDEKSYPLISFEYKILKENIGFRKFDNWDVFFISTFLMATISIISTSLTGTFHKELVENEIIKEIVIWKSVILLCFYIVLAISSAFSFIVKFLTKKKSQSPFEILDNKIEKSIRYRTI